MLQLYRGYKRPTRSLSRMLRACPEKGLFTVILKPVKYCSPPDGTPKLIDFLFSDLSRNMGIRFDLPVNVQEKIRQEDPEAFLAPELIKGSSGANVKTDLYALGLFSLR